MHPRPMKRTRLPSSPPRVLQTPPAARRLDRGRLAARAGGRGGWFRKRRLLVGGVQGVGLLDGLLGGDQRRGQVGYLAVLHGKLLGQRSDGDRCRIVGNHPGGRLVGRVFGRMAGVWLGVWQAGYLYSSVSRSKRLAKAPR